MLRKRNFKIDYTISTRIVMEEWKELVQFPGYWISSFGNIKSTRFNKEKLLSSQSDGKDGYLIKRLPTGKIWIHREVALAFIPNPEQKPEIDHINRDKTDNRFENLRWATRSENSLNRKHKLPVSGHKYIQKVGDNFKVHIRKLKQSVFNRTFQTLEDAIRERDAFITSYHEQS